MKAVKGGYLQNENAIVGFDEIVDEDERAVERKECGVVAVRDEMGGAAWGERQYDKAMVISVGMVAEEKMSE